VFRRRRVRQHPPEHRALRLPIRAQHGETAAIEGLLFHAVVVEGKAASSEPENDPTTAEKRLVEAALSRRELDLREPAGLSFGAARTCGSGRRIRAAVVRNLLLGEYGRLDPFGVRLRGADIEGILDLDDLRSTVALRLVECVVKKVWLRRSHLNHLALVDVWTTEVAADSLHLDHDLRLSRLHVSSDAGLGAIQLVGAHIGGNLHLDGAQLFNIKGPGIYADLLQVDGALYLRDGFRVFSVGDLGAIRLLGARIGGQLACDGAHMISTGGPALAADRMHVNGSVFLRDGFRASGAGERATIRLIGSRFGGRLNCTGGQIEHVDHRPDLDLRECEVGRLSLPPHFAARPDVRGLRYGGIPEGPEVRDWLNWFRELGADSDWGQPYQQLAAAHRAAGHEALARRILIAQQRELGARGGLGRGLRFRHRMLGMTIGYGYQSWRALVSLIAIATIAIGLAVTAGDLGIATHPRDSATPNAHCAFMEQVKLGIEVSVPLINAGFRPKCEIAAGGKVTGNFATAIGLVLQILGYGYTTLFVAGFTGLVRRDL
jgi:hypothetical protein